MPFPFPIPGARARRLAALSARAAGALLCAALAGAAVFWMALTRDPEPGLERSLPAGCGGGGEDFSIRCPDGLPILIENGLPYPTPPDSSDHPIQSLDGTWNLRFDPGDEGAAAGWGAGWPDSLGEPVAVPSTYNAPVGPHRGHQGIAWFARRFRPGIPMGGRVRLCFQGVLLRCQVWLNGIPLGRREGGYTPFYFEVGPLLKAGGNLIVVRADNRLTYASLPPRVRPRHNPVWGVYGGIYRDAYLEALPAAYLAKMRDLPYSEGAETRFDLAMPIHGNAASVPTQAANVSDACAHIPEQRPSAQPKGSARSRVA